MSFFKKKSGIAVTIAAAVVVFCALMLHFTDKNPIANTIRTVIAPFQNGFSYVTYKVKRGINLIWEADTYRENNEILSQKVNELERQNRDTGDYRVENERLLGLLDLKESLVQYQTVAAKVIGYSKNRWYDQIEINKGTSSGLEKGNPVICSDGIVGIIDETGLNWSIIKTIINPDEAIGIRITRTGDIGVVEGDNEMCADSLCKLTFIDKGVNIIVGDMLQTSGAGGIYPPGFTVGTIRDINSDNMGILNYATVEPKVDFGSLREVLVINKILE